MKLLIINPQVWGIVKEELPPIEKSMSILGGLNGRGRGGGLGTGSGTGFGEGKGDGIGRHSCTDDMGILERDIRYVRIRYGSRL